MTGGASGIGRATVQLMAKEGASVIVADVNHKSSQETVGVIGKGARFWHLDVTKEQEWADAIEETLRVFGRLDVVVNAAGVNMPGDFKDFSLADWERTFAVNSTGVFLGCRYGIKGIKVGGRGGSIINVSSMYGTISARATL